MTRRITLRSQLLMQAARSHMSSNCLRRLRRRSCLHRLPSILRILWSVSTVCLLINHAFQLNGTQGLVQEMAGFRFLGQRQTAAAASGAIFLDDWSLTIVIRHFMETVCALFLTFDERLADALQLEQLQDAVGVSDGQVALPRVCGCGTLGARLRRWKRWPHETLLRRVQDAT